MIKTNIKNLLLFLALLSTYQTAKAYQTIGETAELLPPNYYLLGLEPQAVISEGGGFNLGAFFDSHVTDAVNGRISIGAGSNDFWVGGSLKWVPIPDVDRQPAIGIRGGLSYSRDEKLNYINAQVTPIVSKKTSTEYGDMIPFVALPITWVKPSSGDSYIASQFALGAEWYSDEFAHIGAEVDINLSKSLSSVSAFISFPFDGTTGYKR